MRNLAVALAFTVMASSAFAAMPTVDKYTPGNIVFAFEGGVSGVGMGDALRIAVGEPGLVPTRIHRVASGDTMCGLIEAAGFQPPCVKMLPVLDRLNPKLRRSRTLKVGAQLVLPDIPIRRYRTAQTFAEPVPAERTRGAAVLKGWQHLNAAVSKQTTKTKQVEFDAYEFVLRTRDPAQQQRMMTSFASLRSANVHIDAVPFVGADAPVYQDVGIMPYQATCTGGSTPNKILYRSFVDSDGDLASVINEPVPGSVPATVYIVDVALTPSPNLHDALGEPTAPLPASWQCQWHGQATPSQHATHLASIIASRDNGFGFVGLAPNATVVPYEWLQPSPTDPTKLEVRPGRELWLADLLNENRGLDTPQVYLLASEFPKFKPSALDSLGLLISTDSRFDARTLERRIRDLQPLLVVAAGQGPSPIELTPKVPLSPQNLGDLRNVLVVTACVECRRTSPTLLGNANTGGEQGRYVHVAAPGGKPILGWVSGTAVGVASGTSQAAAYTAGVVASMISRWPSSYGESDMVKKRIQVTSWPIYRVPGTMATEPAKVATGLVDPVLSLVDPKRHWLKDADGWRPVRLRGFANRDQHFRDVDGNDVSIAAKAIARVVRVAGGDTPLWVAYRDRNAESDANPLGEVGRTGPLVPEEDAAVVTCADATIPLREIIDLVIANNGFGSQPCA